MPQQLTCFVIMGFGAKTDFQTGRVLDLDKSYKNIIKPAVEAAGLRCIRADEIRHSGVIDVPMYEHLLTADVVVADLSTYNCNAIYELGVRHALRPYTTITIAENQIKYPFDVNHIAIRCYEHMGKIIDYDEALRMQNELKLAIQTIVNNPQPDSPVYTYIRDLTPPEVRKAAQSMAHNAPDPQPPVNQERISLLMEQANDAKAEGDWSTARSLYARARKLRKDTTSVGQEEPHIIQQLALATYKSGQPDPLTALNNARALLELLNPETTHDPETCGLMGAVQKHLYEATNDRALLDEAIGSYEHGFSLSGNYYNGINLAYLLNVRAAIDTGDDAIADSVWARRVRRKVIAICHGSDVTKCTVEDEYWIAATLEEAYFGLGDNDKYEEAKAKAIAIASQPWMRRTTEEQIQKLRSLLDRGPGASRQQAHQ